MHKDGLKKSYGSRDYLTTLKLGFLSLPTVEIGFFFSLDGGGASGSGSNIIPCPFSRA